MANAALVLNPLARVRAVYDGPTLVGYNVRAPVRGVPLQSEFIDRAAEPEVVDLLVRLSGATDDVVVEPDAKPWSRLRTLGFLVDAARIPDDVGFPLDVETIPWDLAPGQGAVADASEWVVAPSLVVQHDETLPQALADRVPFLPEPFRGQHPLAWVTDSRTGTVAPYRLDRSLLARLAAGRAAPPVDADTARVLREIGVFVPARGPDGSCLDEHARELTTEAMTRIGGLIPRAHVAWMRAYYRRRLAQGYVKLFTKKEEKRYVDHNEPIARFWLTQLVPIVSRLTGASVKPSYVFFASYVDGSALRWHVDRQQCEYSMSLLLDYAPDPAARESPWPLLVERVDRRILPVHQRLGDALVYRGRQRPHARPPLPVGHTSTSLFLHYVDESFEGALK